jgi:hypothetical protein
MPLIPASRPGRHIAAAALLLGIVVAQDSDGVLRWCVESEADMDSCNSAADVLTQVPLSEFSCILLPEEAGSAVPVPGASATTTRGCENYIKNDVFEPFADFAFGLGLAQYNAFRDYGLKVPSNHHLNPQFPSVHCMVFLPTLPEELISACMHPFLY